MQWFCQSSHQGLVYGCAHDYAYLSRGWALEIVGRAQWSEVGDIMEVFRSYREPCFLFVKKEL